MNNPPSPRQRKKKWLIKSEIQPRWESSMIPATVPITPTTAKTMKIVVVPELTCRGPGFLICGWLVCAMEYSFSVGVSRLQVFVRRMLGALDGAHVMNDRPAIRF